MTMWIPAAEAAAALGISRATLYAYVSRGLVRSQASPGSSRSRRYAREDIDRLRRLKEERRHPDRAAARALQWGLPVLESSITYIDGGRVCYRGHDVVSLARTRSIADVASLIWIGRLDASLLQPPVPPLPSAAIAGRTLPFIARAQTMLARAAVDDAGAFDLRPAGVARTGARILQLLAWTAAGLPHATASVDRTLARAWGVDARGADLIRAGLILIADHELNVSSFTARCVASAAAHPYAVVIAGLAALEGTRHGGASARVETMLQAVRRARSPGRALGDRLRHGETIDGFGHPLYAEGDPRAAALLELLRERYRRSAELKFVTEIAAAASALTRDRPNVDFALAGLARVLQLPPGSPLTLFAIGRTIGWIGHAIEQYETNQLIRPRAKYVGILPE